MDNLVDTQALALATYLIGLDEKSLQPFDVNNAFNDDLRLRRFLCQQPDHRYGALAITDVRDAELPQLILATPKLHYPFGKDGSFHFPPVKTIHLYEFEFKERVLDKYASSASRSKSIRPV